ncbi:MAG: SHOCT domain-containing protein [Ilumatobacteraceae bacterium]
MFAYDYPLMGAFWTMLWFFLWIAWIILLFKVFGDIFRSHDMGGWAKALWSIFVILVPFLGVFVYVIARGHGMTQRDVEQAQAHQQAFDAYVRDAAGTGSTGGISDELTKLADLKERGAITDAEFADQKAKLLA